MGWGLNVKRNMKRQTIRLVNMQSFVVLVIFLVLSFPIHGNESFEFYEDPLRYCSNTTFSRNRDATYVSNLNLLSSALSSNASSHKLYHKSSIGRPPDRVYGDFLCRGDLNATACGHCVATATFNSSQNLCPGSVEAVVWLDECFLRYSNQSFFSVVAEEPSLLLFNSDVVGEEDVEGFDKRVLSTLDDAVAIANASSVKFGTKDANFRNQTVFSLAQCSGDLSTSDCGNCLRDAVQQIPKCCSGKKGGRVLFPSCTVRYELYPFHGAVLPSSVSIPPASAPVVPPPPVLSPSPSPPPPSLPSSPSTPPPSTAAPPLLSGKGRATVTMVIRIIAAYFLL